MIKLNFKVDKHHLAYKYVLKYFGQNKEIPDEWLELKKSLMEKYEHYPAYLFFEPADVGHGLLWYNLNVEGKSVIRDEVMIKKIFEEIFESLIFKKVYFETEEYKKRLEKVWLEGNKYIEEYEKIIALDTSSEATILVLHQEIETGSYIGEGVIEWGNPDLYSNYQLIGLCHEYLHSITEKQYNETKTEEEKWLLHSIIYLSADEELRLKINGDNGYFKSGVVNLYHPLLIKTAEQVLSSWKEYMINHTSENIVELYEKLRKQI